MSLLHSQADPAVILESRFEPLGDFLCRLSGPAFDRGIAAEYWNECTPHQRRHSETGLYIHGEDFVS